MKIKLIESSYDEVKKIKKPHHEKPIRPNLFFRTLMKLVALPDLLSTHFKSKWIGMERLGKKEPALFLMNHSSFIDLEIVASLLYPRPFNIIATGDGFIGKDWLMRHIGCIPTNKFVTDPTLVRDIIYAVRKKHDSIVLFPEAGYSFDGTSTTLPETTAQLIKMLKIPVVMIHAFGAFSRDPLYNNLQRRKVDVSATVTYVLSPEEIAEKSVEEINEIVNREFSFDNFEWQHRRHISIKEDFRADGLNRVLYKCPHCLAEGKTIGEGTVLRCLECGASYTLDEYGYLIPSPDNPPLADCAQAACECGTVSCTFVTKAGPCDENSSSASKNTSEEPTADAEDRSATDSDTKKQESCSKDEKPISFSHVPDWYRWERECVREELERGEYSLDVPVDICMTVDTKHLYHIGLGRLRHSESGFVLDSEDGTLHYEQKPKASYTVNSDFNWYEIGDVISIGNNENLFYCFPTCEGDVVAKTRLAAEELYKREINRSRADRKANV